MTSRVSVLIEAPWFFLKSIKFNFKERFIRNGFGEKVLALLATYISRNSKRLFRGTFGKTYLSATRHFIFPTKTVISNIDRLRRTVLLTAYGTWFFGRFFPKVWKQARRHGRGISLIAIIALCYAKLAIAGNRRPLKGESSGIKTSR